VLVALSFIIVCDLGLRLIPDRITLSTAIYVVLVAAISGLPALARALLGAAIAGLLILVLAIVSRGGIGGGDLKLMVAIGAALGWELALTVFVGSQVVGLLVILVLSIVRKRIFRGWLPIGSIIAALASVALLMKPI